ncbi:MAG TPA: class IV adenylate cyclase [Phycisphaerae bacterium]|nr:class IV adenylate cyclase [Phycisphaerae bacterium]
MKNLEQKFRCADLAAAEAAARQLGATDRGILQQHDYFFSAPNARLKLRRIAGREGGELISYRRPDSADARTSDYTIAPIANADALITTLTHALGTPRELIKTRRLFIYKSTRIHIDRVADLGAFVELETMLTTQTPADAEAELNTIVEALHLRDPVPTAYVDLVTT